MRNALPQHRQYEGRLAIPYLTDFGPVNMSFRCMEDHRCKDVGHGKILKMKGWSSNLYGVQSFSHADEWIAVTEGEIDRLTLTQIGMPAVGVPGSENWKQHWTHVFEDFSRIYIFTDGDEAGDKMWSRWQDFLGTGAIRVPLPQGEDPNSIYVKYGPEPLWGGIKK